MAAARGEDCLAASMPYNDDTFRHALTRLLERQKPPPAHFDFVLGSTRSQARAGSREVNMDELVTMLDDPDLSGLEFAPAGPGHPEKQVAPAKWGIETSLTLIQVVEGLETAPIQEMLDQLSVFVKSLTSAQLALKNREADSLLDSEDARIASIAAPVRPDATPPKEGASPRAARKAAVTRQDSIRALLDGYEAIAAGILSEAQDLDASRTQLQRCLFIASAVAAAQEIAEPGDADLQLTRRPIVSEALRSLRSSVADIDRLLGD